MRDEAVCGGKGIGVVGRGGVAFVGSNEPERRAGLSFIGRGNGALDIED